MSTCARSPQNEHGISVPCVWEMQFTPPTQWGRCNTVVGSKSKLKAGVSLRHSGSRPNPCYASMPVPGRLPNKRPNQSLLNFGFIKRNGVVKSGVAVAGAGDDIMLASSNVSNGNASHGG